MSRHLPDPNKQTNKHFFIFIIQRLIKLKIKYENIFNEKLTMYDETIKKNIKFK